MKWISKMTQQRCVQCLKHCAGILYMLAIGANGLVLCSKTPRSWLFHNTVIPGLAPLWKHIKGLSGHKKVLNGHWHHGNHFSCKEVAGVAPKPLWPKWLSQEYKTFSQVGDQLGNITDWSLTGWWPWHCCQPPKTNRWWVDEWLGTHLGLICNWSATEHQLVANQSLNDYELWLVVSLCHVGSIGHIYSANCLLKKRIQPALLHRM